MAENNNSIELFELIKTIEEAMTKAIAIANKAKTKAVKGHKFAEAATARDIEKTLLDAQQILFPKKD